MTTITSRLRRPRRPARVRDCTASARRRGSRSTSVATGCTIGPRRGRPAPSAAAATSSAWPRRPAAAPDGAIGMTDGARRARRVRAVAPGRDVQRPARMAAAERDAARRRSTEASCARPRGDERAPAGRRRRRHRAPRPAVATRSGWPRRALASCSRPSRSTRTATAAIEGRRGAVDGLARLYLPGPRRVYVTAGVDEQLDAAPRPRGRPTCSAYVDAFRAFARDVTRLTTGAPDLPGAPRYTS